MRIATITWTYSTLWIGFFTMVPAWGGGLKACHSAHHANDDSSRLHGNRPRQDDGSRKNGKGNQTSLSPGFSCRAVAAAKSILQGRCQLHCSRKRLIFNPFVRHELGYRPGFRKPGLTPS